MEGDAGTRRLNPTDADETPESLAVSTAEKTEQATELQAPEPADEAVRDGRRPIWATFSTTRCARSC